MSVYITDASGRTRRGVSGRDADAYLARMKAGETRHLNTIGITLVKITTRTYEFAYQNMPHHPGRISRRDARSIVLDYLRRENARAHYEGE